MPDPFLLDPFLLPFLLPIAERSEGVSGAFIKELMRRASQYYLDDRNSEELSIRHIDNALEEMLFSGLSYWVEMKR